MRKSKKRKGRKGKGTGSSGITFKKQNTRNQNMYCANCFLRQSASRYDTKLAGGCRCSRCGGNVVQRKMLAATNSEIEAANSKGRVEPAKAGETVINFGKHKGSKFRDLPTDYLQWLRTIAGIKWAQTAARNELMDKQEKKDAGLRMNQKLDQKSETVSTSRSSDCSLAFRAGGVEVAHPLFFQVEGGGSTPISALQLRFGACNMNRAMELNREWHSVLPQTNLGNLKRNRRYVAYTAEFDGLDYAVAIWTCPVAANRLKYGDRRLELRRMAIAPNAPHNTASRMIAWMRRDVKRKWPELVGLVSYQDTAAHKGTIYAASGWKAVDTSGSLTKWSVNWRIRNDEQSKAPKMRWEWWYDTLDGR